MPKSRKISVVAVSPGDVSKKSKGRKKDLLAQWWQDRLSKKNLFMSGIKIDSMVII